MLKLIAEFHRSSSPGPVVHCDGGEMPRHSGRVYGAASYSCDRAHFLKPNGVPVGQRFAKLATPRGWLFCALIIIILISIGAWIIWPDLGGNLFSEALGIFVTVAVLDRLIDWHEGGKLKPARLAAFRDAMEVSHAAREFLLALARSSIPFSEFERVKAEENLGPSTWMAEHLKSLECNSVAPYGTPPPIGNGHLTWDTMVSEEVDQLQRLIDRYLQRHTPHADPILTEAVHAVERNALFLSLSYGTILFWRNPLAREIAYKDFIARLSRLIAVTSQLKDEYSQGNAKLSAVNFEWRRLAIEIGDNPTATPQAPWRPSPIREN